MKTKKEIQAMIDLLKLQRQGIPATSGFGDDNHGNIDSQVAILEKALKLDDLDIEDNRDECCKHGSEIALSAWDWLCGDGDNLVEEDDQWVERSRTANKVKR